MNKVLMQAPEDGYVYKTKQYRQMSRWLTLDFKEVTPRHRLYPYAVEDLVTVFKHKGREYALEQFMRLDYCSKDGNITLEDGTKLIAYDATEYHQPYLLELDERIPAVRLWVEEFKAS